MQRERIPGNRSPLGPAQRHAAGALACLGALSCLLGMPHAALADPPGGTSGWTQTFSDDFNSVDGSKWVTQATYPDSSGTLQPTPNYKPSNYSGATAYYYPSNVSASGGYGGLTSRHESNTAPYGSFGTLDYDSAWLASKFSQTYGYFECRMQAACTQGMDVGFWMLQQPTGPSAPWPPEIDVCEIPAGSAANIYGTPSPGPGRACHQGLHSPDGTTNGIFNTSSTAFSAGYHTYGVDWEPDHVSFYLDGVLTKTVTTGIPTNPMYMIVSNEMETDTWDTNNGGQPNVWFGDPSNGTYPQTTSVDYVRVWKKNAGAPINHRIGLKANITGYYASSNQDDSTYLEASWATSPGTWEYFDVRDAGGGNIALFCEQTGRYVTVDMNQGSRVLRADWATSIGSWEPFQWVDLGGGNIALRSLISGDYVTCDVSNSNHLEAAWATTVGSWEQFSWTDLGGI